MAGTTQDTGNAPAAQPKGSTPHEGLTVLTDDDVRAMFDPRAAQQFTVVEMRQLLTIIDAVAEAIRDMTALHGYAISGHLYANLCGLLSLKTFQAVIQFLKRAGLVSEANNQLVWVGGDNVR